MTVKFVTVKGSERLGRNPFYVGLVQHDRTLSPSETYEFCASHTGYKATAIRAVFMALAEFIRENQRKGNITFLDGVASIRNYVKGAFEGLGGPWVKGRNYLSVQAVELEPFKTLLAGIASLKLFSEMDYGAKVKRIEGELAAGLAPCRALPNVKDVRVKGAVGIVEVGQMPARADIERVIDAHGVWLRPFCNFIYTMPPLVTDTATIARICGAIRDLAACEPGPPPPDGDFHE